MTYLIGRSGSRLRSGLLLIAALTLVSAPAVAANVDAGKYQVVLGDCRGCHGKDLSGGVTLMTPFGKLVTPNITPDKQTGIGNYTEAQFRDAMKTGVAPGGELLYPAMPYPAYARMPDGDIAAMWSYLQTVKPVNKQVDVNQLHFPFNLRVMMRGWNMLFFNRNPAPDNSYQAPPFDADWGRGEYLVNGPGHCAACHTAKNLFGADKRGASLTGAALQGWYAPDLTGDTQAGLGSWSVTDIVEYLGTGRNAHSIASGPMAEAVENSTSQMTGSDLKAVADYLKRLRPSRGNGGGATGVEAQLRSGRALYAINCAACHGFDGKGSALFPALAGNANVRQVRADTIVRVVLEGSQGAATQKAPTGPSMPSLGWKLSNNQAADILTYVRNNWGNRAPAVSGETVGRIRGELHSGS